MKIKIILRSIINKLRVIVFPSVHDKEVKRYFADGGDEMFRYSFQLSDESLVMDLGGFKGQWASDVYARYNCRILVFEPVKMFFDDISKRFINNKKIEVFCLALGSKKRQETISLSDDGSSTFLNSKTLEKIQFEDIAAFFSEHSIKDLNLIKINIEGGEYEVLPRLIETGLIKNIEQIQVQFHDVGPDSEMQMEKIRSELTKTHTSTAHYKFVWENWVRNAI